MTASRRFGWAVLVGVVLAAAVSLAAAPGAWQRPAASTLPAALTDREYWQIIEDFSEPEGFFQSENLVGNERPLQHVVPALEAMEAGGAYLGVAPDQNHLHRRP